MSNYNYFVPTKVNDGETLSLYASMYGCSVDDIRQANGLNGNNIKTGQVINVPVGKKPDQKPSENNVLDKKLAYFDNKLEEAHMKLYDPNLELSEREQLEAEYIELKNLKKQRDEVAQFTKSDNGINLVLELKEGITVSEFRKLFPECTTNFMDYAYKTNQSDFIQGEGFYSDPNQVILHAGSCHMVKSQDYAKDDGDGFWRSIKKTFGGRLDGK